MESVRVLVVDDDPFVLRVLSRQLRNGGCMIRSAADAEQAILLAERERFDVILLDLVLPDVSGFSAIKTLKNISDAVILAMTGYADEEIRKDAMLLGAVGLLEKPFEYRQLMAAICDIAWPRRESPSHEVDNAQETFDRR